MSSNARLRLRLPLLLMLGPSLAALPWPAARADVAPLRIYFDAASLPTMYADGRGGAAGIYPSIVRHAFARIGEPVQLVAEPFRRMYAEFQSGRAAAGALVRTAARLALADYSRDYFTERLFLYQRSDDARRLGGLDTLRGLRIGLMRGWSYGDEFDAARELQLFQTEETDSDSKNFAKLLLGRVDAVVATEMAARLLLEGQSRPVVAASQPLLSMGIGLAIPKALAAQRLLQRFDEAIIAMRRERLIDALVAGELALARAVPL